MNVSERRSSIRAISTSGSKAVTSSDTLTQRKASAAFKRSHRTVKHDGPPRIDESDYWGSRRVCVWVHSCVYVIHRPGRRPRQLCSLLPVICAAWSLGLVRRARLLRGGLWRSAGCLGDVWGVECASRSREVAQTDPSSGPVAVRFRARSHRSNDRARRAWLSGAPATNRARVHRSLGGGLRGWAGGVVVASKPAERASTNRNMSPFNDSVLIFRFWPPTSVRALPQSFRSRR